MSGAQALDLDLIHIYCIYESESMDGISKLLVCDDHRI
jgi:hypothetical protein